MLDNLLEFAKVMSLVTTTICGCIALCVLALELAIAGFDKWLSLRQLRKEYRDWLSYRRQFEMWMEREKKRSVTEQ